MEKFYPCSFAKGSRVHVSRYSESKLKKGGEMRCTCTTKERNYVFLQMVEVLQDPKKGYSMNTFLMVCSLMCVMVDTHVTLLIILQMRPFNVRWTLHRGYLHLKTIRATLWCLSVREKVDA